VRVRVRVKVRAEEVQMLSRTQHRLMWYMKMLNHFPG